MTKLLIVESPTKAKTIKKFLGSGYEVLSSFGHIRDLPKSKMGIDFENDFEPEYVVSEDKKDKVAALRKAAKAAKEIYLATDEDREGEAIAWHIASVLDLDPKKAKRITFHEITKGAIEEALTEPRHIEMPLVDAQQARRILDRIVGYELSPFLWKKVQRGLSAGRVQSVAVRLIVERERERKAFKQDEYWTIEGEFEKEKTSFPGKLIIADGKKLKKLSINNEEAAKKIEQDLKGAEFVIDAVEKKHAKSQPPTPLRTSILQQEANNKLGYSAKQTMALAQKLYETGRITYMRTDSLNLSSKFMDQAQAYLKQEFGGDYAKGSRAFKTNSKGAQEAHEAIRPTSLLESPESLKGKLEPKQWKLYDLIWRRTLASQMPAANIERTAVDIKAKDHVFRANGSIVVFDGYMRVYRSSSDKVLPDLTKGDSVNAKEIESKQHFTEPPARYSDAMLIKALEEHGIGRPSTYAPTISTITNRGYIERDDNKKLFPTDIAEIVNDLLVEHFADIVDLDFTAEMEQTLDDIADGKKDTVPMLKSFYKPFHTNLEKKSKDLERDDIVPEIDLGKDPKSGKHIYVKTGQYGAYVQLGEYSKEDQKEKKPKPQRSSLLKGMQMHDVDLDMALKLLSLPRTIGKTKAGEDITLQIGPYGPYLKAGKTNVGLPEDITNPFALSDEEAEKLFIEAKKQQDAMKKPIAELGEDPETGGEILIKNGRFGPYVTDGKTNASISKKIDPASVDREQAIEMLKTKRAKGPGRGRFAKKKK